jgi:hypothetical protein
MRSVLVNIVIFAITLVGVLLLIPVMSEVISIRIFVIIILGLFFLIPIAIIIALIKKKAINKKWYVAVIFLLIIFAGLLFKTFSLSEREFQDIMNKIDTIDLLSS